MSNKIKSEEEYSAIGEKRMRGKAEGVDQGFMPMEKQDGAIVFDLENASLLILLPKPEFVGESPNAQVLYRGMIALAVLLKDNNFLVGLAHSVPDHIVDAIMPEIKLKAGPMN